MGPEPNSGSGSAYSRGPHNTQLQQGDEVTVYYRFHPFHGKIVTVRRRRADQGDDGVVLVPPSGRSRVVPIWMLDPQAAQLDLCEHPRISKQALIELRMFVNVSLNSLDTVATGKSDPMRGAAVPVAENDQKSRAAATATAAKKAPPKKTGEKDQMRRAAATAGSIGLSRPAPAPTRSRGPKRRAASQEASSGPKRRR